MLVKWYCPECQEVILRKEHWAPKKDYCAKAKKPMTWIKERDGDINFE